MYVIGDIGGQYSELMELVDKLPDKKRKITLLGDLNDRGYHSKEVIQWAIDNESRVTVLDSNHGEMFVDFYMSRIDPRHYKPRYDDDIFTYQNGLQNNGGRQTLMSYGYDFNDMDWHRFKTDETLAQHIKWLDDRFTHVKYENTKGQKFILTHAPLNRRMELDKFFSRGRGFRMFDVDPISRENHNWNRYEPDGFHPELDKYINVYGHNSMQHPKLICHQYKNGIYLSGTEHLQELMDANYGEVYAIGIDTSSGRYLTALDLDNFILY